MGRLWRDERGQATVEFLGVVPAVLLISLMVWQLVLAGQTAWLAANAARVAARAQALGKDPEAAARSALPKNLEDDLVVRADADSQAGSEVRVHVRMPLLLHRWRAPLSVAAAAQLPSQL